LFASPLGEKGGEQVLIEQTTKGPLSAASDSSPPPKPAPRDALDILGQGWWCTQYG